MPAAPTNFGGQSGQVIASKPATAREALPAILVACFAAFGGILYGYDTGTISGLLAMQRFKEDFGEFMNNDPSTGAYDPNFYLTTGETSLITSILSAGTFFGALLGAPLGDLLGRKLGLQATMVVFVVGVIIQLATTNRPVFIVGRVVAGLGIGMVSTLVVLYQSETAPRWIRGAVVSGYQWCITIGLLLAAIVNNSTKDRADTGSWRIPVGVQIGYALVMSIGLIFLPESPRWLVKVGKPEKAAQALARLNSHSADSVLVRSELADIQTAYDYELTYGNGTYLDCFTGGERRHWFRTMTGTLLQGWQQLTGINFIFYYGTIFFGTISSNAFLFSIVSNVVNVVCTIPSFFLMERLGRRWMLVGGAFYMAVCELLVAALGTAYGNDNPMASKAMIAFVCIYISGFAATWGPGAWVVCGEIFPLSIRAKALSLCTASNWLWNFGIGYATPYLVNVGPGEAGLQTKVFWIWTATCFCAGIFAYFTIYETKGASLEEVDGMYAATSPRGSARYLAQMKNARVDPEAHIADDEAVTADRAKHSITHGTKDASNEDLKSSM
ncbi:putative monosaccharide transporter [Microstroma glucosiphilum]|uniref:Putative monosaccharide transporter n=1 Tax=Pseudomicrostroma glucosiphilum TaxID=1684307 RepID=A0A316U4I6_9BASI|nr:putative monosaccharide transporter [Pseudomicrostroma glucosiphilum]PWN17835.1 putative monosaccharide transporter [Pseudomicrostroma glucosiphilum]